MSGPFIAFIIYVIFLIKDVKTKIKNKKKMTKVEVISADSNETHKIPHTFDSSRRIEDKSVT